MSDWRKTRALVCIVWSMPRGNVFMMEGHTSPIMSRPCLSLAYVDEPVAPRPHRKVPGQEWNFYHFIIGHTGLSKSCSCSQPNPSTSESSTHSCFVLVLSFHPPNLSHMFPGIRLIQGDISFAILITAHCWRKQNISVNEWLWDVNRHILNSIKV